MDEPPPPGLAASNELGVPLDYWLWWQDLVGTGPEEASEGTLQLAPSTTSFSGKPTTT